MNSMTGFGVSRGKLGRSYVAVEVKSVNHRFCEVNLRFPSRYASFEPEAMQLVRKRFARGKFDFFLREESVDREAKEKDLARKAYNLLLDVKKDLKLKSDPTLADILAFREVAFSQYESDSPDQVRKALLGLVGQALDQLGDMRAREGKNLLVWLEKRIQHLSRVMLAVEKEVAQRGANYRKRVEKKWKAVLGRLDQERLLQEETMIQERGDVTEEVVRLKSHLQEFAKHCHQKEPMGRKFDFLIQEMGREINTIGSKTQGIKVTRHVIDIKSELEKIREQVQNVE